MISDTKTIKIQTTSESRLHEFDEHNLKFGREFTDHMFCVDFENGDWRDPQIVPYQNISMSPATSFIHYGQSIFEGLKAHKSETGQILLFRPHMNWERLNRSAARMCMEELPEELFIEGITQLLKLDKNWIPSGKDTSMYIRPFMFGTETFLGVRPSDSYRFMVIMSPAGPYYSKPVRVKIETTFSRAMEGGVGATKTSGNYGASLYPATQGLKEGYDQLIWTDSDNHNRIEESGTMNVMFVINGKLVTPKLTNTILPGITRDSILTLARDGGIDVEERDIHIPELINGIKNGTLTEAFGAGTAAAIAQIASIGYNGQDYELNPIEDRPVSLTLGKALSDYKHGRVEDKYNWLVRV